MFLTLLATLAVLGQAPAPSETPLTVLIAPPEAAGVPSHIVSFAQEHVYEQLKTRGMVAIRASELSQELTPAQRKEVLGCNRLEAACRITLGEAAEADVVLVSELVLFLSGYRVGLKAYATRDGELLAEYYVPGVREDQLLDALTRDCEKVLPPVLQTLLPSGPGVARPQTPVTSTPTQPLLPTPPEVKASRSGAPGWAWLPAAGGAVLVGAGTYFLVQAGNDYRALKNLDIQDADEGARRLASGKRSQMLSQGAYALGAAGVVTTGLIYLLSGKHEEAPKVRPTATVGPSGGMVGVAGTLP